MIGISGPKSTVTLAAMALLLLASTRGTPALAEEDPGGAVSKAGCGVETACRVAGGEYRIRFPRNWDGTTPVPAIVFLHGWRGSAEAEMRNAAWATLSDRLGVAFVAPQGEGGTWSFPGSPSAHRDEFRWFDALVADMTDRFPLRADRLMVAGFSMGGSMVWSLACRRGELFAGFAPVAGAFWDPIPDDCPSPAPVLLHVHGRTDRTVPLEGRSIGDGWRQSDVGESLAVFQRSMGVAETFPDRTPGKGFTCQSQESPKPDDPALLRVCLHDGGHSVRAEWIADAFETLAERRSWQFGER